MPDIFRLAESLEFADQFSRCLVPLVRIGFQTLPADARQVSIDT